MEKRLSPELIEPLNARTDTLELSVRVHNVLHNAKLTRVRDLAGMSEDRFGALLVLAYWDRVSPERMDSVVERGLKECREALADLGLSFGMTLDASETEVSDEG